MIIVAAGMEGALPGSICVVNIDNGYGAGYVASMINRLKGWVGP